MSPAKRAAKKPPEELAPAQMLRLLLNSLVGPITPAEHAELQQLQQACSTRELLGLLLEGHAMLIQYLDWQRWEADSYDLDRVFWRYPDYYSALPAKFMTGYRVRELLFLRPDLAPKLPLDRLNGYSWRKLLERHPLLFCLTAHDKLTPKDWLTLIETQPQFIPLVPWQAVRRAVARKEVFIESFSDLLGEHPYLLQHFNADEFSPKCAVRLIQKNPQFAVCWEAGEVLPKRIAGCAISATLTMQDFKQKVLHGSWVRNTETAECGSTE